VAGFAARGLPAVVEEHQRADIELPGEPGPAWQHLRGPDAPPRTDALGLPGDCIVRDANGAPYLRYYNHKMRREALVPVDEELERAIGEHRRRLRTRWPQGAPRLFPKLRDNPGGHRPVGDSAYRNALHRWLKRCDIRDEHGQPVHLTPHQWRHTLGTQMKRRGVASDATFRGRCEDGAVRDGGPGTAGRRSRRQSDPAGRDGCDRTALRQMLGCCVHSGCIRRNHDAVKATKRRNDEDRCHCRPVVILTHSAWLVNRSLPVSTGTCRRRSSAGSWTRLPPDDGTIRAAVSTRRLLTANGD
jgi:hypothetical protein